MSNGNEPAYPVKRDRDIDRFVDDRHFGGLTKREAFAMAAMQGFAANAYLAQDLERLSPEKVAVTVADMSKTWADALLAALTKEP